MTRYEPGNELHQAMLAAYARVFGDHVSPRLIEQARTVKQSGRFLNSINEIDYCDMTRKTLRRARTTFDHAYEDFIGDIRHAWKKIAP